MVTGRVRPWHHLLLLSFRHHGPRNAHTADRQLRKSCWRSFLELSGESGWVAPAPEGEKQDVPRPTILIRVLNSITFGDVEQDEQSALAEDDDEDASAYAELCVSSLYRESSSKQARAGASSACPTRSGSGRCSCADMVPFLAFRQAAAKYTPRLVFLDVCGALGGVTFGDGSDAASLDHGAATAWGGGTKVVQRERLPKARASCTAKRRVSLPSRGCCRCCQAPLTYFAWAPQSDFVRALEAEEVCRGCQPSGDAVIIPRLLGATLAASVSSQNTS